jgi:hypothetical protein
MHRFRSFSSVFNLWLGSLALIATILGFIATVVLIICTLIVRERILFILSLGMIAFVVTSGLTHLVISHWIRCPLCHGKLLASQKCVRSRNARTSLGSYRLGVAKGVLLKGYFRCPYCGEPCACAARER